MTVLLAVFAVFAHGESRTLRHYRQQRQHANIEDLVGSSIHARIEKQQIRRKAAEANSNDATIISDIFDGPHEEQMRETHYGIGRHADNESQSSTTNGKFQNVVPLISIQTAELGGSDGLDAGGNNLSNGTIYSIGKKDGEHNLTNGAIYSIGKKVGDGSIISTLSNEPEERSNYAIRGGEKERPQSDSSQRIPICRDCYTISDGSVCTFPEYECCSNDDCIHSNSICSHRNCIIDDYFRFTLKWIGDDDYDLYVVTPDGAEISYEKTYDPASLGTFQTQEDQVGYGYHVENIYFPIQGGPSGVYRFYVRPYLTVEGSDIWTVTVKAAGNIVAFESGVGSSGSFFCKKDKPQPTVHPISSPTLNPTKSLTRKPVVDSPTIPAPVELPFRPPLGQPTKVPVSLPAPVPTVPTLSPQSNNNDVCDAADKDECCFSSDCQNEEDICEQRTCIKTGNPRFTLKWSGYNYLDMFVITPDGVTLSPENTFDMESGGTYERDTNDQASLERRVQNIYFPREDSPGGTYQYGVRYNDENGADTLWTIESHDEDGLFGSHSGLGNSQSFSYFHSSTDGPQRPNQSPPACSLENDECCIDGDCTGSIGDLCIQRTCISEGSLRVTLEWTGNDNLHLSVATPSNALISNNEKLDIESGGRHESSEQSTFDFNVESVHFPSSGAPVGVYKIIVDTSAIEGEFADTWTIRIYEDGEMKFEETRSGDSTVYTYEVESRNSDDSSLCKDDSGCADDGSQVCVRGACIREGNPRFTLQWPGGSFYSLSVITPDGTQISAFAPFDADSRGIFEGPTQQLTEGDDVESVYFPVDGGPLGLYVYYVTNSGGGNTDESWIVTVHVNGESVATQTGSGNSDLFSFQFEGFFEDSDPYKPQPDACDETSDCLLPNGICINQFCFQQGNPQFVLSWYGESDYTLSLATPLKTILSLQSPSDVQSGGIFERYNITDGSSRHVERIYFETDQGPTGLYPFYIKSNDNKGDVWNVSIFVNGKEIDSYSGQGASDLLFFEYTGNIPVSEPSHAPTSDPSEAPTFVPTKAQTAQPSRAPTYQPSHAPTSQPSHAPTSQPSHPPTSQPSQAPTSQPDIPVEEPPDSQTPDIPVEEPPDSQTPDIPVEEPPDSQTPDIPIEEPPDSQTPDIPVEEPPDSQTPDIPVGEPPDSQTPDIPVEEPPDSQTPDLSVEEPPDSQIPDIPAEEPPDSQTPDLPAEEPPDSQTPDVRAQSPPDSQMPDIWVQGPPDLQPDIQKVEEPSGSQAPDIPVQEPPDSQAPDLPVGEPPDSQAPDTSVEEPPDSQTPDVPVQEPSDFAVAEPPDVPAQEPLDMTQRFSPNILQRFSRDIPKEFSPYVQVEEPPDQEPCDQECCINADCSSAQICSRSTCVKKGSPQFLLSWEGDYDVALQVVTPAKTTISWQDPIDFASGGRFEQYIDFVNNRCIENVFFAPNKGLRGIYPYYVHSFATGGIDDTWTVTIYVDGREVRNEIGKGSSEVLFFEYKDDIPELDATKEPTMKPTIKPTMKPAVNPVVNPIINPILHQEEENGCDPFVVIDGEALTVTNGECCSDANCFPNESCTSRTCVDEGNPRFTLSWIGANDLDLLVVTPQGTIISYSKPEDPLSGGRFGENYDQFEYGLHVENVYFPKVRDEPFHGYGEYSFYVRRALFSATDDKWTVGVYINGEEQLSISGTGNSKELKYTFSSSS